MIIDVLKTIENLLYDKVTLNACNNTFNSGIYFTFDCPP